MDEVVSSGPASRRVLLRAAGAAWPSLALYLGVWPSALAGEWTAVWLFFFSGTFLAVTLGRAHYIRARARGLNFQLASDRPEKLMSVNPEAPTEGAEQ